VKFSGVVLAGGKSRRMGFPKHLIEVEGIPLWRRQMDLLSRAGASATALSLGSEQPVPDPAIEVVRDTFPDSGPLGGIAAALTWSPHPRVLVLAVDLPLMTLEVLQQILETCDDLHGCVPYLENNPEPLAAIYPIAALDLALQRLKSGRLAARGFADDCATAGLVRAARIATSGAFENANTPRQLSDMTGH
jgi:molybdopterin-guanine dinucleotide biosynthesis protein A